MEHGGWRMKKTFCLSIIIFFGIGMTAPDQGSSQDNLVPQVPFNLVYAGGVTHTFFRVEHPRWDAVEFQTSASGAVTLMMSALDGQQIQYLDQEPMVQVRKKFDTSPKPRDYRFAPMKYHLNIDQEGKVEALFVAETDVGKIDAKFLSMGSLKEINQVVDPLNHAMEVIAILHMERDVPGDERSEMLLNGEMIPIKRGHVSFVQGANFGIIFRTDQRVERLVDFRPGRTGWLGARWVFELEGNRVTYSIEKEKDAEGYYEIKRLGNMITQKAWVRPAKGGREVRRVSTYSLVHENKEFVIEFEPALFFPASVEEKKALSSHSDFRAKISNSGWCVNGRVGMKSRAEGKGILTEMDFLPGLPKFLGSRPVFYEIIESPQQYRVIAREGK
jgi:hypothetical protein